LDNCHYDVTEASGKASNMNATIVACRHERINSCVQFEGSPLKSAVCTKGTEKNHGIFKFILKCPLHSVNSPKCLYRKNKLDVQSLKSAIAKKSVTEKRPQRSFFCLLNNDTECAVGSVIF
jgi:hypothetical protein